MKQRRLLVIATTLLGAAVLLAGTLAITLWFWTGTDTSLATAIQQTSRFLPTGQSLVAQDVRGSLRKGGHIGRLRWEKNGLVVEARQVELAWEPVALFNRRLQLDRLHAGQLTIDDKSPPVGTAPLDNLSLPFQVNLKFSIDQFRWVGSGKPKEVAASGLAGDYQFDGMLHGLKLDRATFAQGQYRGKVGLLAKAPLTLDLQLLGEVNAPIPGKAELLPLTASLSVRGDLAGSNDLLEVRARLRPVKTISGASQPTEASVIAQISPWSDQPFVRGTAEFENLNLEILWPQAPQTSLTGRAQIQPDSAASTVASTPTRWQAQVNFTNRLSGAWNLRRLPIDTAQANFSFNSGQWLVQSLTASAAGGTVAAKGQLTSATASEQSTKGLLGWQLQTTLQNINPASLHTQLVAAKIDGTVNANTMGGAVVFDTQLKPSAKQPDAFRLKGLQLKLLSTSGRWEDELLSLKSLKLQTTDAMLEGDIDVQVTRKAARGNLAVTLPGGYASVRGDISASAGSGEFAVQIADATRATQWLNALPDMSSSLSSVRGFAAQGNGDLKGGWSGGWRGNDQTVIANLKIPQMGISGSGVQTGQSTRLRNIEADLSGRLSDFAFKASGQLVATTRSFNLQIQARGSRKSQGDWHASISSARLQMKDQHQPSVWDILTRQPIAFSWTGTATSSLLELGSGEANLTGPIPGSATLAWHSVRYRTTGSRSELQTKGQFSGVPLVWLESLGNTQLASSGLRSDLVFDGDWDIVAAEKLSANVSLRRRSGDVSVLSTSGAGALVNAGVKDAHLTLNANGEALRAIFRWDSERAGFAEAEFSTTLARIGDEWRWPAKAPVTGTLKAKLPEVGVWSLLAPPGWRIRGTMDANIELTGTRREPLWSGTLSADNLAIRSIADGIEFSNGKLRSTLNGQRLDIDEFSLKGVDAGNAGERVGGSLTATGYAQWLADGSGASTALSKIKIELSAQAQSMRVSARADRRLAVTGNLQLKLFDSKLNIRGALKADQAFFVLPDENTPSLGDDVVVKRSFKNPASPYANDNTVSPLSFASVTSRRAVPDVAITLDTGPDFQVQGRGLSTRLAGTLSLVSSGQSGGLPRLTGSLNTVRGTYKAYGQQLAIEEGVLRFNGPVDNPSLDILAVRPNLTVRVGVQISGTALSPRVRLYAEPEMAEAEKLAWLVLGRSAASGGAESAVLQQAALALLGGKGKGLSGGLASALGLDEFSYRGSASNTDGSTSAAAVTLGKRLSRNFYVAYERSVAGTLGTVFIFYDLSKRFTLRAQAGELSAIDLIFTLAFD